MNRDGAVRGCRSLHPFTLTLETLGTLPNCMFGSRSMLRNKGDADKIVIYIVYVERAHWESYTYRGSYQICIIIHSNNNHNNNNGGGRWPCKSSFQLKACLGLGRGLWPLVMAVGQQKRIQGTWEPCEPLPYILTIT